MKMKAKIKKFFNGYMNSLLLVALYVFIGCFYFSVINCFSGFASNVLFAVTVFFTGYGIFNVIQSVVDFVIHKWLIFKKRNAPTADDATESENK